MEEARCEGDGRSVGIAALAAARPARCLPPSPAMRVSARVSECDAEGLAPSAPQAERLRPEPEESELIPI